MTQAITKPSRSLMRLRIGALAAIVAATALLSSCSSTEGIPAANPQVDAESQWNPESWKPHSTFKRPQYTEEEKLHNRQVWLDQYVRMGATPKDLPIVRWVTNVEFADLQVQEYANMGIEAIADEFGGIIFPTGLPQSQEAAANQRIYDLYSHYPIDPLYGSDYSTDQLGMLWDYWTEYYLPCMAAQGFPIDPSPVSRETFVATFFQQNADRWWPLSTAQTLPLQKQQHLSKTCPGLPPAKYFYGE